MNNKICLLAISTIYLMLSSYQLNLPGLHYDEAFEAVPSMQLLHGQPVTAFRSSGLRVAGQTFPLMTQDYIGAINTYTALPFIAMFGTTPHALRLMSVLTGLITLLLAYLLTDYLTHNPKAGLSAALILAVDPTFIFWNRQGIFVTAVTATIGLAATYCWLHRLRTLDALCGQGVQSVALSYSKVPLHYTFTYSTRDSLTTQFIREPGKIRWTMAGAFLFGLGLYAKFLFLWLIVALMGTLFLLNFNSLRVDLRSLQKQEFLVAIAAFLLGCWPLLVYNWQTGGTWLNITQNSATSYYGVNNLAFGHNLIERLNQFVILLNGSHLWYLGKPIQNFCSPLAFGLILFLVVIRMFLGIQVPNLKIALFPFLVIAMLIFASIGTVSALWITHFAILMAWPTIAISVGGWFIQQTLPKNKVSPFTLKALTSLGLTILVMTNLASSLTYHQTLKESGGLSSHSDAIYKLSDWLAHQPLEGQQVVAMDWGLAAPITYLTNGQVVPIELFGYAWQSDSALTSRLNQFILQPNTLYLWRAPDEIIFDRSNEFKALYRPLNLEENIENAFYERSGRPILGVTRLVKKGTATTPP